MTKVLSDSFKENAAFDASNGHLFTADYWQRAGVIESVVPEGKAGKLSRTGRRQYKDTMRAQKGFAWRPYDSRHVVGPEGVVNADVFFPGTLLKVTTEVLVLYAKHLEQGEAPRYAVEQSGMVVDMTRADIHRTARYIRGAHYMMDLHNRNGSLSFFYLEPQPMDNIGLPINVDRNGAINVEQDGGLRQITLGQTTVHNHGMVYTRFAGAAAFMPGQFDPFAVPPTPNRF